MGRGKAATPARPSGDARSAEEEKVAGNRAFGKGEFDDAVLHYSLGIESASDDAVMRGTLFANRAAARLKLGDATKASADAKKAVKLRPDWPRHMSASPR